MDNWRDWLPETDLEMLNRYEAQGIKVVWREAPSTYHGAMQMTVEAWDGAQLLANSDPVQPRHEPDVIRGCVRQMPARVGMQLRAQSGE